MPKHYLSVTDTAALLGISPGRVRQLITARRLPAEKVGPTWIISLRALEKFAQEPPGKPGPKPKTKRGHV